MIDWTEIKAEYHQKVSAETAENGVDTEDLPITDNTAASVIVPEEKRKKEFAKVKRLVFRNTRLERWLNCWLNYLRDGYKAAASVEEKSLIATVGKLWQGVINEVHGVYCATIPTNELLNLLDYCDLELASNDELKDEVSYNREFLIHVFKLRCGLTSKARVKSAVRSDVFIDDFKATLANIFPVEGKRAESN